MNSVEGTNSNVRDVAQVTDNKLSRDSEETRKRRLLQRLKTQDLEKEVRDMELKLLQTRETAKKEKDKWKRSLPRKSKSGTFWRKAADFNTRDYLNKLLEEQENVDKQKKNRRKNITKLHRCGSASRRTSHRLEALSQNTKRESAKKKMKNAFPIPPSEPAPPELPIRSFNLNSRQISGRVFRGQSDKNPRASLRNSKAKSKISRREIISSKNVSVDGGSSQVCELIPKRAPGGSDNSDICSRSSNPPPSNAEQSSSSAVPLGGGSLWGAYDERANAESFNEARSAWLDRKADSMGSQVGANMLQVFTESTPVPALGQDSLWGTYSEGVSAQSFQDARAAWIDQETIRDTEIPAAFENNLSDSKCPNFCVSDSQVIKSTVSQSQQCLSRPRNRACYNCYKLFSDSGFHDRDIDRLFCTELCATTTAKSMRVKCAHKACGATFLRADGEKIPGIIGPGGWFCSQKHAYPDRTAVIEPTASPDKLVVIQPTAYTVEEPD
eukprot:177129_1